MPTGQSERGLGATLDKEPQGRRERMNQDCKIAYRIGCFSVFEKEGFERTATNEVNADGFERARIQRCPGQRRRSEVETRREDPFKLKLDSKVEKNTKKIRARTWRCLRHVTRE